MAKVTSDRLLDALEAAGIVEAGGMAERVVVDLRAGQIPRVHVQRFGDERLVEVIAAAVELRDAAAETASEPKPGHCGGAGHDEFGQPCRCDCTAGRR